MAFRIFTNTSSQFTQRALANNSGSLGDVIRAIGSGDRLQRAGTDSASFAVSSNLRADARILRQAQRNADDAMALMGTSQSSLKKVLDILNRMRELAEQSVNGTVNNSNRQALQLEFNQLKVDIDRIARNSDFSGRKVINGDLSATSGNKAYIQIGLDASSDSRFDLNQLLDIPKMDSANLGISDADISNSRDSVEAVATLGTTIKSTIKIRNRVATIQKQLSYSINNLGSNIENLRRADSALRDTDLSSGFAQLTRDKILVQASTAMVGQANLAPRTVLQLL